MNVFRSKTSEQTFQSKCLLICIFAITCMAFGQEEAREVDGENISHEVQVSAAGFLTTFDADASDVRSGRLTYEWGIVDKDGTQHALYSKTLELEASRDGQVRPLNQHEMVLVEWQAYDALADDLVSRGLLSEDARKEEQRSSQNGFTSSVSVGAYQHPVQGDFIRQGAALLQFTSETNIGTMLDVDEYVDLAENKAEKQNPFCATYNGCYSIRLSNRDRVPDISGDTYSAGNSAGLIFTTDVDSRPLFADSWYHNVTRTFY